MTKYPMSKTGRSVASPNSDRFPSVAMLIFRNNDTLTGEKAFGQLFYFRELHGLVEKFLKSKRRTGMNGLA